LCLRDAGIRTEVRIASRADLRSGSPDDSVGEQPAAAVKERDIADPRGGALDMSDREDVARLNGREHAAAVCAQAGPSEPLEHFADQQRCGAIGSAAGEIHEFLRTRLHCRIVGFTFPQASAVASNTSSRTNAGFT
jgi:hypothetical protein